MAKKTYQVNDFWLDIDKENHVDIESTDGVITSVKINGVDIGGGETWHTVFDGEVTTVLHYGVVTGEIDAILSGADQIKVSFNGTEYECEKKEFQGTSYYGADPNDFSVYPFIIQITTDPEGTSLTTETAGTYSLKIEEPQAV